MVLSATTITFDGFADSTVLTSQIPGLSFSDAVVLSAGISLNEFEFPPHSGTNVISDNGGPIRVAFATPVQSVEAYFTYAEPLTFEAFNSLDQLVATTSSLYSDNDALSGDPGSTPNELLAVTASSGISFALIAGDPSGGSFTLDDLTYGSGMSPVPEPSMFVLMGLTSLFSLGFYLKARAFLQ
jgi:hypothetical protein